MHNEPRFFFVDMGTVPLVLEDDTQRTHVELVAIIQMLEHARRALRLRGGEQLVATSASNVEAKRARELLCPKQRVGTRLRVELLGEPLTQMLLGVFRLTAHLRVQV